MISFLSKGALPTGAALLLCAILAACSSRGDVEGLSLPPELEADRARQGTVISDGDPELDVRSWRLVPMNVSGAPFVPGVDPGGRELRLGAVALVMGPDHPFNPNRAGVQLLFMGISDDWLYEEGASSLELTLDEDEPLELPVVGYDESPGQGYVLETMTVPLPVELLLRLVDSRTVVGRLGPTEFQLDASALGRLGGFVDSLPAELLGPVP